MNRIEKDTGEFVLRNIFKDQLFESLERQFPEVEANWSSWATSIEEYTGDDGKEKTKIKGCFDVSGFYTNSKLVAGITRVAAKRLQAAIKYYSTKDSKPIDDTKIDVMLSGFEELWGKSEIQQAISEKLDK